MSNMVSFLLKILIIPFLRNINGTPRQINGKTKVFMIDIDNTICITNYSDYESAKPIKKNIDFFNNLYDKGNIIHYWTARGMNSGKNWDVFTINQMEEWEVKYDTLNMNKPHYDYWIDDKAINIKDF